LNKRVAIVQSCYIPWKGYFDLIASVDEFIIYDDTQFTRRDWRNRNIIKTPHGLKWLTIPVAVKGRYHQKISDTKVIDLNWAKNHWNILQQYYGKAPFFYMFKERLETLYLHCPLIYISDINLKFIIAICEILEIKTKITSSKDYCTNAIGKTERLVQLCKLAGANEYLSGPSAASYLDVDQFKSTGINLSYSDYSNYPTYQQSYGKFEHAVTIFDLLFHTGLSARKFMKSI
jgi:hypothetical protein